MTVCDHVLTPLIIKTLNQLHKATIFAKIGLWDAFNQICMKKGNEWKTAFWTRYSHYKYCVLPFGLYNAPVTFQHFVNHVL